MASTRPIVQRRKTLIGNHPTCSSETMNETYAALLLLRVLAVPPY